MPIRGGKGKLKGEGRKRGRRGDPCAYPPTTQAFPATPMSLRGRSAPVAIRIPLHRTSCYAARAALVRQGALLASTARRDVGIALYADLGGYVAIRRRCFLHRPAPLHKNETAHLGGLPQGISFSLSHRSSFRSSSPIQPHLRRGRAMSQLSRAGRTKHTSTSPIQSVAVMAALVPASMSASQPRRSAPPGRRCPCRWIRRRRSSPF